jgi:hypothetical protein
LAFRGFSKGFFCDGRAILTKARNQIGGLLQGLGFELRLRNAKYDLLSVYTRFFLIDRQSIVLGTKDPASGIFQLSRRSSTC